PGRGRIPRTSTPSVRGGGRPDARHAPRTGSGAARPTGQDGDVTHSQADQSTPRSGPIRVVLVDDQALVRGGFSMLIMASDDMEVVGEAGNGEEALRLLRRIEADVVLMDIRMPVMDGVETTRRLVADGIGTRVLVLTTFDLDEYVFAALKAGAAGFLLKDARPEDLLSAIRSVAAG